MNQHLQLLEREGLSASIYTQPFDVEGEQNGLMTYDREVVKIPFAELIRIHSQLNPSVGAIPGLTAKDAETTEPSQVYAALFQKYLSGLRGKNELKQLAQLSIQLNDAAGKNRFAKEYIASLTKPYSAEDIAFFEGSTKKVTDPAFNILVERESELTGKEQRSLHVKLMNIVYQDIIAPYVPTPQAKPNWDEVAEKVKPYGSIGEEIYLRAKTIHTLNQQDWDAYKPVAKLYLEKYGNNIKPEERTMFESKL